MTDIAGFEKIRDCRSKRWLTAHFEYPHDDRCLIWPFARKGGGYSEIGNDHIPVHRIMCEHRNGPPPSPTHHAAHSCGRGHEGCINPWHLNWRTPSENQFERYEHQGEPKPRYRITPEQAAQIRALKGVERIDVTASNFGMSMSNVSLIQAGKTWKSTPKRLFSREEVEMIRSTPWQVKTAKQFAAEFGVHRAVIERIRQGESYRYFKTEDPHSEHPQAQDKTP